MCMTSRQRMLGAINHLEVDHIPCSFMLFNGLKSTCADYLEFVQKQIELGLDAYVQVPPRPPIVINDSYNLHGLPVNYHPSVLVEEWKEYIDEERYPVLFKEYHTPAGTLRAEVFQDDEWRWGDHVPFLDDYLETRSKKYLINGPDDLAALRYLLTLPTETDVDEFVEQSQPILDYAYEQELLVAGGWGVGADLIGWIYGLQNMIFASFDDVDFLHELLDIIANWNRARMEVVLSADIDLYIKRAWYENCDFWSPKTYEKYLSPILEADVELAHDHGAKFGYLITSNCMPLLDYFAEAGVDVLIGVDPHHWDLGATKQKLGGKVCLWGGVNGNITVEYGTPEQVRMEVGKAMGLLSSQGGFILSPVDNVRDYSPRSQENVQALIEEWEQLR
jgi:uroporphyrinogen-III decarboxylase